MNDATKKATEGSESAVERLVIRRVVCAACEYDGVLILGARHWDKAMNQQYDMMRNSKKWREYSCVPSGALFKQGFIDQFNVFMDRKEAMQVAIAAGQPVDIERGCGGDSETLYSEGLY